MRLRSVLTGAVLIATTAAVTSQVVSQDHQKGMPEMSPEMAEFMKKWEAFATPGEHHEHLARKVGTWEYLVKWRVGPEDPWTESTGRSEMTTVMGGRYLLDHTEGQGMAEGQTFVGMGITGYDNLKKSFRSVWIDNMSTAVTVYEGNLDDAGAMVLAGHNPDVLTGGTKPVRSVETVIDADHWKIEMFEPAPDGGEFKNFELFYKRAQ